LTVTVTNTGNRPTGDLTINRSNAIYFTLNNNKINSIGVNGTASFTVVPVTESGIGVGTYNCTITVSGDNNIQERFTVSFTVKPAYDISLDLTGHTFPEIAENYGEEALTPLTVTVTNNDSRVTGELTISISPVSQGIDAFGLNTTTISPIDGNGTAGFEVVPVTGLEAGTYTATVTVSGGGGVLKRFYVYLTVTEAFYGIRLSQSGLYTFPDHVYDYSADLTTLTVTVTNVGNQATGDLTITRSGQNSAAFRTSDTTIPSIEVNGTASFRVEHVMGWSAGTTYNATVTVSGGNGISAGFPVRITVLPPLPPPPLYGISLNPSTYTFPDVRRGHFEDETMLTVTVTNSGTQPTGQLTVTLEPDKAFFFTLGESISIKEINSIPAGQTASFQVTNSALLHQMGTHTAEIRVTGAHGILAKLNVQYTTIAP
jgi:uncharacterized membrane protein